MDTERTFSTPTTVADYLVRGLKEHGVDHLFGVPGDFALSLFDHFAGTDLHVITTCDEQDAGFAADAYARVRGLSAVCVTYGVGGLKIANSTARTMAEDVPVVAVLNNEGCLTERLLTDGFFYDLLSWRYAKLSELLGAETSFVVKTEGDLEDALVSVRASDERCIVEVDLTKYDSSPALKRLTEGLNAQARGMPSSAR